MILPTDHLADKKEIQVVKIYVRCVYDTRPLYCPIKDRDMSCSLKVKACCAYNMHNHGEYRWEIIEGHIFKILTRNMEAPWNSFAKLCSFALGWKSRPCTSGCRSSNFYRQCYYTLIHCFHDLLDFLLGSLWGGRGKALCLLLLSEQITLRHVIWKEKSTICTLHI